MGFKDQIAADITNVFLNMSEFADTHTINGKSMKAIIDDDMLDGEIDVKFHGDRQQTVGGLYNGGIALYVSASDLGKPKPGAMLEIDGKRYSAISTSEQDGMLKITIQKVGGR